MHLSQVPLAQSDAAMFVVNSAGCEADIFQRQVLDFFRLESRGGSEERR